MSTFHPRNRHQGHYDFPQLMQAEPALATFVHPNVQGINSVDFTNPAAVRVLNRALLQAQYGINAWDIPTDYLCPAVPGRADYLHYLADLLASANTGKIPKNIIALDIGTGANCIYPLLGHSEYGWQFVATDTNAAALANVKNILDYNPALAPHISLRLQADMHAIFEHIIHHDEWFDVTLCNPPFHASLAEANAGTQRKWRNLDKKRQQKSFTLNFGGLGAELYCDGGELGFIRRMITESASLSTHCYWFTTLVSKSANLIPIYAALKHAGVQQHHTINMAQGAKQSRFVAWTFLTPTQQAAWRKLRW
ncbi:MAG: 23S rRNA (adenine(1618)-N(6))-methyltransferase RlmF [Sulfuriferula sp.]|nr:23S rRNA (adenine(1618)-N(6))-methyltransferase RlmF [Sulfuriferula sp.]